MLWTLSADETLQRNGAATGIRYQVIFDQIIDYLQQALHKKSKDVVTLFQHWDSIAFPGSETSIVPRQPSQESGMLEHMLAALDEAEVLSDGGEVG